MSKKFDYKYLTVGFYNLENLFDTKDDQYTRDEGFLPDSERKWTEKRYKKKLRKLGYTISKIGKEVSGMAPAVLGVAEVENEQVIEDLLDTKFLKHEGFGIVHYDSPDERGIDTAMIYKKEFFTPTNSEVYSIELYDEKGQPDHTRDILHVTGELDGELMHFLVNHWPSRRDGAEASEPNRIIASNRLVELVNRIYSEDENAKVIIMGDFNDDPGCKSIKNLTHSLDLYNPMSTILSYSRGSLNHRFQWNLFDQIMFSSNFFERTTNKFSFDKADIFDRQFLKQFKGKYKGNPFRTYVGTKYKGGYSDHFPVCIYLKKHT